MNAILMDNLSNLRNARGRSYSIFYHARAIYPCPECTKPMPRLNAGFYWGCTACKKSFPLRVLDKEITHAA